MNENITTITVDEIGNAKKNNKESIIHNRAYSELNQKIKETLERLGKPDTGNMNSRIDINDCRVHNTIFINGARGSGKTTFLVNIEANDNVYMLPPLDPTLYNKAKSFLTIIISQIKSHIQDEIEANSIAKISDENRERYYKSLRDVINAIEHSDEIVSEENKGLAAVINNEYGLKLEQLIHQFFKEICSLTGKKLIIFRLDDIDMAFSTGFDVLETIRKYLSSPYVLPIATGDYKLYDLITNSNFSVHIKHDSFFLYRRSFDGGSLSKDDDMKKSYAEQLNNLSETYLSKVYPIDKRIDLNNNILNLFDKLK